MRFNEKVVSPATKDMKRKAKGINNKKKVKTNIWALPIVLRVKSKKNGFRF